MPATVLDKNTALVCIDLQKGISQLPVATTPFADVVKNAVRLADAMNAHKLPVVLVRVAFAADGADRVQVRNESPMRMPAQLPPEWSELVPELKDKGTLHVVKHQPNAFYGTDLDLQLRRRGVTGIILCGVSTSIGVYSTAVAANERGYNITFATDAMSDMNAAASDAMLKALMPRIGELDTTDAIVSLLSKR